MAAAQAAGLHLAGSIGLVLANCLNMLARIAYALAYVRRVAAASTAAVLAAVGDGARDATPHGGGEALRLVLHPHVLVVLGCAFGVTNASRAVLGTPLSPPMHQCVHVAVGGVCLLAVGAVAFRRESELLVSLRAVRRSTKKED